MGFPEALNAIELVGAKDMTRHDHDALADKLEKFWPEHTRKSLRPAILQIILGTAFVNRSTILRANVSSRT